MTPEQRFKNVDRLYLKLVAEHVKEIGELSVEDLNAIEQMARMSRNMSEVMAETAKALNYTMEDMEELYQQSLENEYRRTKSYYDYRGIEQVPYDENLIVKTYAQQMKRQTYSTMLNLVNSSQSMVGYQEIITTAQDAVVMGVTDYKSAVRSVVNQFAGRGLRVQYPSGATRRLDGVVRMHVLDGAKQFNNGMREIIGREFGADGVEVDAHGLCAPDHQDIQGRQFSITRFELIQSGLKRPISTCNCGHSYDYIVLGISEAAFSKKQLQELKDNSNEIIDIDGMEMTRYDVSQLMRKLESTGRRYDDQIYMQNIIGNMSEVEKISGKLTELKSYYRGVAKSAGLSTHYDRMAA